jgi:hypothetical protein
MMLHAPWEDVGISKEEYQSEENTSVMSHAEFERRCEHYSDYAFYTPPERFMFQYYDDPHTTYIAERPMVGMERYVVVQVGAGGYCGVYNTRDISRFIKMETWKIIDDEEYFVKRDIRILEEQLAEKQAELNQATCLRKGQK